jgi:hypothetical protein
MNTIPTQWLFVLGGVIVLAALALVAWLVAKRRKQSRRLQQHFGPEYGRTVDALGGRTKAESDLRAREERVDRLTLTTLTPADAARFSQAWNELQGRFIDNPKGAVAQADQLVRELMLKRGYPMGDFERRSADISVDHPTIVASYRAAQAIAVRDERGVADTEELRQAVVHFRALFDELLEVQAVTQEAIPAKPVAARAA